VAYLGRDRPRRAASGVPPRPPRQPSAAERASHPLCQGGERHRAPRDPRERLGLDVAGRSARAGDARDEVTKGIVEFLDVRQHAHGRMVGTPDAGVHAVPLNAERCMTEAVASANCALQLTGAATLTFHIGSSSPDAGSHSNHKLGRAATSPRDDAYRPHSWRKFFGGMLRYLLMTNRL